MPVNEAAFENLRERVAALEQHHAVRVEIMRGIEARLAKIEAVLSRLTWLLVISIGGAFLTFIVNGGLSSVPSL